MRNLVPIMVIICRIVKIQSGHLWWYWWSGYFLSERVWWCYFSVSGLYWPLYCLDGISGGWVTSTGTVLGPVGVWVVCRWALADASSGLNTSAGWAALLVPTAGPHTPPWACVGSGSLSWGILICYGELCVVYKASFMEQWSGWSHYSWSIPCHKWGRCYGGMCSHMGGTCSGLGVLVYGCNCKWFCHECCKVCMSLLLGLQVLLAPGFEYFVVGKEGFACELLLFCWQIQSQALWYLTVCYYSIILRVCFVS